MKYGSGIAIEGDTVVVGAENGNRKLYIHERNGMGWDETILTCSYVYAGGFGSDVDINDGRIAVGARFDSPDPQGAVYIYDWDGSNWIETKIKQPFEPGAWSEDQFGNAISLGQDSILIGAHWSDDHVPSYAGAAFLYTYDGTNWIESADLVSSSISNHDNFGTAVALDEGVLAVSAIWDNNTLGGVTGRVFLFEWDGTQWNETIIQTPDGPGNYFGSALAKDGDRIVVGARRAFANGVESGAVYVYDWDGANWVETKLSPSDGDWQDDFGWAVDLEEDTILVGAPSKFRATGIWGQVYRYEWDGSNWNETIINPSNNQASLYGWKVKLNQGRELISAMNTDTPSAPDAGTVQVNESCLDQNAPTAVCTPDTAYLLAGGIALFNAYTLGENSTDDCDVDGMTLNINSADCSQTGPFNVVLTVSDCSSNTSSCNGIITVLDTIPPTAVCQNISRILDSNGQLTIIPDDINNGSSDNCSIESTWLSQTQFDCSHIGDNTIELYLEDRSSNLSTCFATLSIQDTISPVAQCANIIRSLDQTGHLQIQSSDLDIGSFDNCGIQNYLVEPSAFNCTSIGDNSVSLSISDSSGNLASCTAIVTVADSLGVCCPGLPDSLYLDQNPIADGIYEAFMKV